MANQLINGTASAMATDPEPTPEPTGVPTWGYRIGEGQIFYLGPGESLPEGWVDSPARVGGISATSGAVFDQAPELPESTENDGNSPKIAANSPDLEVSPDSPLKPRRGRR